MNEVINEKVDIVTSYNRSNGLAMPCKMRWQGREYFFEKLTYHHKIREGRTLLHIFHVTDGTTDFRLHFDTDTLHWFLKEVCDGTPS